MPPPRDKYVAKLVRERYGNEKGRTILEIGGSDFTVVSDSLSLEENYLVELDNYRSHLDEQIELTSGKSNMDYMLACAPSGHVYNDSSGFRRNKKKNILPFKKDSFDIIFLFCYPMYMQTNKNLLYLFSDLKRILKRGGEIVVSPNFKKRKHFLKDMFNVAANENYLLVLGKE